MAWRIIYQGTENVEGRAYVEAGCNSGDTKEHGNFLTMSQCVEADSGQVFFYDEESEASDPWIPQFTYKE